MEDSNIDWLPEKRKMLSVRHNMEHSCRSVRSDFAFYEASELLGTKEMTVREFIERIADVCRCIKAGS
jgi:hypothetical protein|nr:MAG TPA: hypothetical protein [Caudoviricetes sp.]